MRDEVALLKCSRKCGVLKRSGRPLMGDGPPGGFVEVQAAAARATAIRPGRSQPRAAMRPLYTCGRLSVTLSGPYVEARCTRVIQPAGQPREGHGHVRPRCCDRQHDD